MKLQKSVLKILMFTLLLSFAFIMPKDVQAAEVQYTGNVIPKMTSNTNPSGKASASSLSSTTDFAPYLAFDRTTTVRAYAWSTANNVTSAWLEYEFPSLKSITKYTLTATRNTNASTEMPKDWTFEAYDEGTKSWIILDTQKEVKDWQNEVKKEFTFKNNNLYKRYRINITANNGASTIIIGLMEMMESITNSITLTSVTDNQNVALSWTPFTNAEKYNIKRSTTSGGPYETIATVTSSSITYTDKDISSDITYYYVVSVVVNGEEKLSSNEVTSAPLKANNILKLVLEKNEVKQLSVSEDLEDNTELTWTSSDATVATVDANGKVKALKPGDTVITCTSEDGEYTDTIKVLVVVLDYQLAVDLLIGEKCRLTVDDAKDTAKATWVVNDPTIATVTSKGKVTAVGEGLTFITATDEDGKEIGKIFIRVRITE